MSAKFTTCPICGARTKIEYGTRLREHHQPIGYICPNYDLTPIPSIREQAAALGPAAPAVTDEPGQGSGSVGMAAGLSDDQAS